jgi:hypothetical protein
MWDDLKRLPGAMDGVWGPSLENEGSVILAEEEGSYWLGATIIPRQNVGSPPAGSRRGMNLSRPSGRTPVEWAGWLWWRGSLHHFQMGL